MHSGRRSGMTVTRGRDGSFSSGDEERALGDLNGRHDVSC